MSEIGALLPDTRALLPENARVRCPSWCGFEFSPSGDSERLLGIVTTGICADSRGFSEFSGGGSVPRSGRAHHEQRRLVLDQEDKPADAAPSPK